MSKRPRENSNSDPLRPSEEHKVSNDFQVSDSLSVGVTEISTRQPKIQQIVAKSERSTDHKFTVKCSLPPHPALTFDSVNDLDIHYKQTHVNRCLECFKNFPSPHFLELHISENHDPFKDALKAQGEGTYACLVPVCDRVCSTLYKRRLHCIDKHGFPKSYDFFIVNDGIDRRTSMLRSPRYKKHYSKINKDKVQEHHNEIPNEAAGGVKTVVANTTHDDSNDEDVSNKAEHNAAHSLPALPNISAEKEKDDMEGIISSMSSLQFVPPSVRFGGRRGRSGFTER